MHAHKPIVVASARTRAGYQVVRWGEVIVADDTCPATNATVRAMSFAPQLAAVHAALDAMDAEYAQMPFFVRPLVRRGFSQRTGADLAGWRALLATLTRGPATAAHREALARLRAHFEGAPARARRGMGARADELREVEARAAARVAAVQALLDALA